MGCLLLLHAELLVCLLLFLGLWDRADFLGFPLSTRFQKLRVYEEASGIVGLVL